MALSAAPPGKSLFITIPAKVAEKRGSYLDKCPKAKIDYQKDGTDAFERKWKYQTYLDQGKCVVECPPHKIQVEIKKWPKERYCMNISEYCGENKTTSYWSHNSFYDLNRTSMLFSAPKYEMEDYTNYPRQRFNRFNRRNRRYNRRAKAPSEYRYKKIKSCMTCPQGKTFLKNPHPVCACQPGYEALGTYYELFYEKIISRTKNKKWSNDPFFYKRLKSLRIDYKIGRYRRTNALPRTTIYNNHGGKCLPCSQGRFSADGLQCLSCPKGKFSPAGSAKCFRCPESHYPDTNFTCTKCPKGKFAEHPNSIQDCQEKRCPAGSVQSSIRTSGYCKKEVETPEECERKAKQLKVFFEDVRGKEYCNDPTKSWWQKDPCKSAGVCRVDGVKSGRTLHTYNLNQASIATTYQKGKYVVAIDAYKGRLECSEENICICKFDECQPLVCPVSTYSDGRSKMKP
eukprot:g3252.t1